MNRDEALKLLKGGHARIAEWNKWRKSTHDEVPDLRRADLSGANLGRANFSTADLSFANLGGADLFTANLSEANLSEANLSEADLRGAHLSGANVIEAILAGALCRHTVLADVDLSQVTGLDSIKHLGPSTIGIDTLFRSKGNIPEAFLRGCGVHDALIEYLPALIGSMDPIQFYSCFISYSSKDRDFAERLHADLHAKRVRCWFDHKGVKIGDRFRDNIDEAIRVHDKLMVVLSEHSIASDWVGTEVEAALERERREKNVVLFPIQLDDAVEGTRVAWASHIRRTRCIGDFRQWRDHDSYKKAFELLLTDLKAAESTSPGARPTSTSPPETPR
jgi:TIR domain/Pentapeptide repeats (8 copies)